jgi:flagellar motor switch protein FliM
MKRDLSQQEIDAVFQRSSEEPLDTKSAVVPFDFSRLDRIPKSQIRAVHLLHENFSRNCSASLSAYLRAFVSLSLVSLEQISYAEFQAGLASPTFVAYLGLRPYDGVAVMEMNPALVFTFVEMLLGGGSKVAINPARKVTEIEKQLMQNLLRILLQNLSDSWKTVADVRFAVQSIADEPQLLHGLAPAEAVVAISIEVRVASTTGMINLAIPSIFIKRLRHMFDRIRRIHRTESKQRDQVHMAQLLGTARLNLEVRLEGPTLSARDLLALGVGEVLMFDYPLRRQVSGLLNGQPKYWGEVELNEDKVSFRVASNQEPLADSARGGERYSG